MKGKEIAQIAYLVVWALGILEYIFVRGMFTWLIVVLAVTVLGAVNIVLSCKDKEWLSATHYLMTTVTLCAAYLVLA